MSLFGIFYPLFRMGVRGRNSFVKTMENEKSREDARQLGELTYTDTNFTTRLTETGEKAYYTWRDGEQLLLGENKQLIKNITREEIFNSNFFKLSKRYAEVNNLPMLPLFSDKKSGWHYMCVEDNKIYGLCSVGYQGEINLYYLQDSRNISFMSYDSQDKLKEKKYNDFYIDYYVNKVSYRHDIYDIRFDVWCIDLLRYVKFDKIYDEKWLEKWDRKNEENNEFYLAYQKIKKGE